MGTARPFVLQGGSARFGWVVGCQARRDTDGNGRVEVVVGRHGHLLGDESQPYLFRGSGTGQPIARYFGSSPDGRYLALLEGTTHILDAATGRRHELGGNVGRDLDRNWLSFSRAHQAAFTQGERDAQTVVVLDLLTSARRIVHRASHGSQLWRVELADDGGSLSVFEIADDTDGDGLLRPPQIMTNRASGRCFAGAQSSTTFRHGGDEPRRIHIVLSERARPQEPAERLEWQRGRAEDGRPVIAGSTLATLVASGEWLGTKFGPVQWIGRQPRAAR